MPRTKDEHMVQWPSKHNISNLSTTSINPATKKSDKQAAVLLIATFAISAALTVTVLPYPWNLSAIGFGGPITKLIQKLLR